MARFSKQLNDTKHVMEEIEEHNTNLEVVEIVERSEADAKHVEEIEIEEAETDKSVERSKTGNMRKVVVQVKGDITNFEPLATSSFQVGPSQVSDADEEYSDSDTDGYDVEDNIGKGDTEATVEENSIDPARYNHFLELLDKCFCEEQVKI